MSLNSDSKVTVIFPAKNEEGTIETAISTAKQSSFRPEILVVDAYSTDKTAELAKNAGAKVIQQPTQIFPGEGIAMKAGLKESIDSTTDIILF
jgi:glycosyltransferase involved in cell wall biosynthesis